MPRKPALHIEVGDIVSRPGENDRREVLAVDGRTVLVKGTVAYPSRQWWTVDDIEIRVKAWRIEADKARQEKRQKEGWMFWLGAEGEYSSYINNLPRAVANRAVSF